MADVSRPAAVGRDRPGPGTRNRGQLILVTALSLAILFVTLALILNTAIYTENLATRSGDIGGATDAVRYHDAARDGVGGLIGYANAHNNTSHSTLQSNLSTGVEGFRNNSARLFASGNRAVETNLISTENGTRVAQTDHSRNFTNASGEVDWTVATSVRNTRAVQFHVSNDLLALLSDGFKLIITDGSTYWNLTVYNPTVGDIGIQVDGPTGTDTCQTSSNQAWINISDGRFASDPCPVLETFADGVPTPYEIRYENGENINGTYSLVVDNPNLVDPTGPDLYDAGNGQPFAAHAIYSANVTAVYETSRLYYNTTVRVAPGEPDG